MRLGGEFLQLFLIQIQPSPLYLVQADQIIFFAFHVLTGTCHGPAAPIYGPLMTYTYPDLIAKPSTVIISLKLHRIEICSSDLYINVYWTVSCSHRLRYQIVQRVQDWGQGVAGRPFHPTCPGQWHYCHQGPFCSNFPAPKNSRQKDSDCIGLQQTACIIGFTGRFFIIHCLLSETCISTGTSGEMTFKTNHANVDI